MLLTWAPQSSMRNLHQPALENFHRDAEIPAENTCPSESLWSPNGEWFTDANLPAEPAWCSGSLRLCRTCKQTKSSSRQILKFIGEGSSAQNNLVGLPEQLLNTNPFCMLPSPIKFIVAFYDTQVDFNKPTWHTMTFFRKMKEMPESPHKFNA